MSNMQQFREEYLGSLNVFLSYVSREGSFDTLGISDGVNTFHTLYQQRALMFAIICMLKKESAWKHDMRQFPEFKGRFALGLTLPSGKNVIQYHTMEIDWDLLAVKEVDELPKDLKDLNEAMASREFLELLRVINVGDLIKKDASEALKETKTSTPPKKGNNRKKTSKPKVQQPPTEKAGEVKND